MTTWNVARMRMRLLACAACAAAAALALPWAAAQTAAVRAVRASAPPTTIDARAIAASVCAPCHGADGNSHEARYPVLAGQSSAYLHDQLEQFAAQGRRPAGGVMGAFAVALSEPQMQALADYFASQAPAAPSPSRTGENREKGEGIFFEGVPGRNVPACASCHGVGGTGLAPRFPRIAGQHAAYLAAQLAQYRAGRRISDRQALMREVASGLSDHDIAAVAAFASTMR